MFMFKRSPSSVFTSLKNWAQSWAKPFYDFWHKTQQISDHIVDRCARCCLACRQTHTNYSETREILRSCLHIQPRMLSGDESRDFWKEKQSNSLPREAQRKCPQIMQHWRIIWLPKPEVLRSPKVGLWYLNSNGEFTGAAQRFCLDPPV